MPMSSHEAEQRHDHVFHGHVAGAFAEAGDGGLRDGGAGLQRVNGVGDAEAEVLVAVDLHRLLQALDRLLDDVVDRRPACVPPMVSARVKASMWPSVATRSTMSRRRSTSVRVASMVKKTVYRPASLAAQGGVDGGLHGAIEGPAVGVLDHVVAGGNFDDHAVAAAGLDDLDLFGNAAAEGEDFGLQARGGDI